MKHYRTLVRVIKINKEEGVVSFVIPGWGYDEEFELKISDFTKELQEKFEIGFRFHARANLNAENASELDLKDFEIK